MFAFLAKIIGIGNQTIGQDVSKRIIELEEKKEKQKIQLDRLLKATLDGEDEWFMTLVRKGMKERPECAPKIIENCFGGEPTKK